MSVLNKRTTPLTTAIQTSKFSWNATKIPCVLLKPLPVTAMESPNSNSKYLCISSFTSIVEATIVDARFFICFEANELDFEEKNDIFC